MIRPRWRCAAKKTPRCAWPSIWSRAARPMPAFQRRQYRCADGDLPFCPENAARHRSPGHRLRSCPPSMAIPTCSILGANVDCSAEHLLQFGIMGAMLVSAVEHKERPSVGLLNIGEEDIKGNEVVKQAAELLRDSDLNFYGNVEGNDIYKGTTDVVVCDGFVGNVALKASEGLAQMMANCLRQEFKRNMLTKLAGLMAIPVLNAFKKRVDPSPLQWRQFARPARHRGEKPRLGGYFRLSSSPSKRPSKKCATACCAVSPNKLRCCTQNKEQPDVFPDYRYRQLSAAESADQSRSGTDGRYLSRLDRSAAPASSSAISRQTTSPPAIWPCTPVGAP